MLTQEDISRLIALTVQKKADERGEPRKVLADETVPFPAVSKLTTKP